MSRSVWEHNPALNHHQILTKEKNPCLSPNNRLPECCRRWQRHNSDFKLTCNATMKWNRSEPTMWTDSVECKWGHLTSPLLLLLILPRRSHNRASFRCLSPPVCSAFHRPLHPELITVELLIWSLEITGQERLADRAIKGNSSFGVVQSRTVNVSDLYCVKASYPNI